MNSFVFRNYMRIDRLYFHLMEDDGWCVSYQHQHPASVERGKNSIDADANETKKIEIPIFA